MAGDCATDLIWGAGGTDSGTRTDANQYLDDNATCHFDQDVPWLSETPVTGILASMANQNILVTFDAGVPEITQPGQYYAQLEIRTDTPYQVSNVPVTMTVPPPATWGRLAGTITSLGHCDTNPTPLGNAAVLITGASGVAQALTSDTSGTYSLWVEQGDYTVTVSAADHVTRTISVAITAQETTIHNFDLRSIEPCISVAPLSMTATLIPGASKVRTLVLTNSGAAATAFRLLERDGDATLALPGKVNQHQLRADGQVHVIGENKAATPEIATGTLSPLAGGGPDEFGYIFRDSEEPDGPIYEWIEIAPPAGGNGTAVGLSGVDDGYFWPLTIPFPFDFYGTEYTELAVASNGTVCFGDYYLGYDNRPIPGASGYGVYAFIAHFWDDLVVAPGDVYYLAQDDKFIIEYYEVGGFGGSGSHGTWQVILFENDSILFQYQDVSIGSGRDYGASATVGIQGDTATGLQYSYNTPALSDSLAVCFAYPGQPADCLSSDGVPWLSTEPGSGTVGADDTQAVTVTLAALPTMHTGVYTATLEIRTDDAVNSPLYIPMTLTVPNFWQQYMPIVFRNS